MQKEIEFRSFHTCLHKAFIDDKDIAIVDDTDKNDIKVILTDRKDKYIQRFFIQTSLKNLVEKTILMRKLGIKTL